MSKSHAMSADPSAHGDVRSHARAASDAPDREYNWPIYALLCGVSGAFVVALTFLVFDLLSGRPALWTPAVLGMALFLGESVGESEVLQPLSRMPIVLGYTLLHAIVFVSFGALAAADRLTRDRSSQFSTTVGIRTAFLIFIGLEATFLVLGWVVGPDLALARRLGSGSIAVANALAAIAMTATIGRAAQSLSKDAG